MPKYRLMQSTNEVKFNHITAFNDLDNYNLQDIIKFTGVFKSEEELKMYLNKYSLIENNKPLYIQYRFNHKDKKLQYGITYNDDIRFFDPVNIKKFLEQNKFNGELLDKLCTHYKNSYVNNGNIYTIRDYLINLNAKQLDEESEMVFRIKHCIHDFVWRECYRRDLKTYELKPNFKGMRDLAMFLAYQSKRIDNITTDNMDNSNELINYVNNKKIDENITLTEPIKQKTKKKEFPGQMSFIINDGNIKF